jgi:pimeloyl-ACP methyl ester carboxylesterase
MVYPPRRRGRKLVLGLALAGAAVGVPAAVAAWRRRLVDPPQPLRWGRARRYAGRSGEIVFQEIGGVPGGTDLVLLHSFGPGHDADEWRAAAELLASRYCLYAPDLPGWGRSAPPAGGYRPEAYVEALADFLDGVVREPAIVVAAGLPAAYAVQVAASRPGRVRALALISPLGLDEGGGAAPAPVRNLLSLPVVRDSALDLLTRRSALEHHLRREVYAAPERVDAALVDRHYRVSHRPQGRAAAAALYRGDLALDVTGVLEDLEVPVWLAWGRSSAAPKVERADLWLRRLRRADLEVFEGSGALPHAESPAAFCRALDRFLTGLAR